MIVIASGLRAGERVAADGAFKLRDGVLVSATGRTGRAANNAAPDTGKLDAAGYPEPASGSGRGRGGS